MQIVVKHVGDNVFESDAEVYVCPVNMLGLMDAGISRVFVEKYPAACSIWKDLFAQVPWGAA